eukprot:12964448-Alexandrium_andersonii.AAC.1
MRRCARLRLGTSRCASRFRAVPVFAKVATRRCDAATRERLWSSATWRLVLRLRALPSGGLF